MATTADTLHRTNEEPGTRAILRGLGLSAFKVRVVLDLIRGKDVQEALQILKFCARAPAVPIAKLLNSAIANAENNDDQERGDLFVAACFADEGTTAKRWRPRARGRAGRIRKRSCSITVIVSRLPEDRLERARAKQAEQQGTRRGRVVGSRAARVAGGRSATAPEAEVPAVEETATIDDGPVTEVETPSTENVSNASDVTETDSTTGEADVETPAKSKSDGDDTKEEG